jgi:hypothetical protein
MPKTYEPIQTTTLGSNQATVTFSTIPQTYTDLILIIAGTITSGGLDMFVKINSDTGSNYSYTQLYGTGSTAASSRASSQSIASVGAISITQSNAILHFMNYSNSTTYKTILSRANRSDAVVALYCNLWRSTASISSIEISSGNPAGTFVSGSTFTLYGVKSA